MKTKINELKEYGKVFKILYVEDNEEARTQTQKMLSNFFSDITVAIDGKDGLEKYLDFYQKNNTYFDLVITDINMPNMDGLMMSEEILKKQSLQAIIITTAHNEIEFLTKAIDVGVSGFLIKPVSNMQLINVLYKTSLGVSDRKFVDEHIHQMEKMTLSLEKQYKEALQRNKELEQSIRVIDTMVHKEELSHPHTTQSTEEGTQDQYIKEQMQDLITEDLHELVELHSEIDIQIIDIINTIESIDPDVCTSLASKFTKYSAILNYYSFFNDLSKEMKLFSNTLQTKPLPEDRATVHNIFMLLESFVFVIGKWQNDLKSGDENKLNALDASITSDMKTITNMWAQEEVEVQNIFDF